MDPPSGEPLTFKAPRLRDPKAAMDPPSGERLIFKGLVFYIDLDGGGVWGKGRDLTSFVTVWIRNFGGRVSHSLDHSCTHVVARHLQQDVCWQAESHGAQLVSPLWPYHCIMKKELLPIVEKPFCEPKIPGFANHVKEITITDFKSHERVILRYLCECTGAAYSGQLTVPNKTSHLIVNDLASDSMKIHSARRCGTVKIVSKMWLDECLSQWRHVPEGPYTEAATSGVPERSEGNGKPPSSTEQPTLVASAHQKETRVSAERDAVGKPCQLEHVDAGPKERQSTDDPPNFASDGIEETSAAERSGDEVMQGSFLETFEHASIEDGKQEGGKHGREGKGHAESLDITYDVLYEGLDMSQQVAVASAAVTRLACQLSPTLTKPELHATKMVNPTGGKDDLDVDLASQPAHQEPEDACVSGKHDSIKPVDAGEAPGKVSICSDRQEADYGNSNLGRKMAIAAASARACAQLAGDRDGVTSLGGSIARGTKAKSGAGRLQSKGESPAPVLNGMCEHKDGTISAGKAGARRRTGRTRRGTVPGKGGNTQIGVSGDGTKRDGHTGAKRSAVEAANDGGRQEPHTSPEETGRQEAAPSKMRSQNTLKGSKAVGQGGQQSMDANPKGGSKSVTQSARKTLPKRRRSGALETEVRTSKRLRTSELVTGAAKEEEVVVALSGVGTSQRLRCRAVLSGLHVRCASGSSDAKHQWNNQTTHIVLPELKRNEKVMCGMAAGKWLVSMDYVEACAQQQRLLDPSAYELEKGENETISEGAPQHWRKRGQHTGAGAFSRVTALVMGNVDPPGAQALERIICAGDGCVVKTLKDVAKVNLAVLPKERTASNRLVQELLRVRPGVLCVVAGYIIDWVSHPSRDLSAHRLFGTSPSLGIGDLEAGRKLVKP